MPRAAVHLPWAAHGHLNSWLYYNFHPAQWVLAVLYVVQWLVMLGFLYWFFVRAPRKDPSKRWNTQDIFVLAIISVILLAWDSFLNDQLLGPLEQSIPVIGNFLDYIQLNDLAFMFIVMVAAAVIRKPGVVTAVLFIEMILADLLFSPTGFNPVQDWPDALNQGVFADAYIMWRGDLFLSDLKAMLWDGFVIGFMRGGPNVIIGNLILDPFVQGQLHTWANTIGTTLTGGGGFVGNAFGNGIEASITAPLAVRVAGAVGNLTASRRGARITGSSRRVAMATSGGGGGGGGSPDRGGGGGPGAGADGHTFSSAFRSAAAAGDGDQDRMTGETREGEDA